MGRGRIIYSTSSEETIETGRSIGRTLKNGAIICLFGDLGAGKTTLIKGIVSVLTETPPEDVCSPTFAYMNYYPGACPVFHFDLYRLRGEEDFLGLGFEEYLFSKQGICCIEWSERIVSILPKDTLNIILKHWDGDKRKIFYENPLCHIH